MLEKREFYINGEWVAPQAGRDLEVINPSNEEPCAVISLGGQADTDAAVAAAANAFGLWRDSSVDERKALVKDVLAGYTARADDMAEAISLEMGAPQDLARDPARSTGRSRPPR